MLLKQSVNVNRPFLLVSSVDGKTGMSAVALNTIVITVQKDGGSQGTIAPVLTNRGNGWYWMSLAVPNVDTLGALAFHIEAPGCDARDFVDQVVLRLPGEAVSEVLGNVGGNLVGNVLGSVATVGDKTGYTLTQGGINSILDTALSEPTVVFQWPGTVRAILAWLGAIASNKYKETSSQGTLRNRADSSDVAVAPVSDDGTTGARGSFS